LNTKKMSGITIWFFTVMIILTLTQVATAGDWPMQGHDIAHSGVTDEVVEPPLELLWKYMTTIEYPAYAVYSSPLYQVVLSMWDH
jgi:hypothetical protein